VSREFKECRANKDSKALQGTMARQDQKDRWDQRVVAEKTVT
jgi:hypothetical protein